MCFSLFLRLIGERGNSRSKGAGAGSHCECGCYCGIATARNRLRWTAVAILVTLGTVSGLWLAVSTINLFAACESEVTPKQQEDCFGGVEPLPQQVEECQEAREEIGKCMKEKVEAKGQAVGFLLDVVFHVTYLAFVASIFLLFKMCCCTKPPVNYEVAGSEAPPAVGEAIVAQQQAPQPVAGITAPTDSTTQPLLQEDVLYTMHKTQ